jgi:Zn-dependent protease with chaperone function
MVHLTHAFLVILSWFLIGPSILLLVTVAVIIAGVIFAILFRRSFHRQTVALLAILAVMFIQSLQLVIVGLHVELFRPPPRAGPFQLMPATFSNFLSTLFGLNLWLAGLGAVGAALMAIYFYLGKSRLEISRVLHGTWLIDPSLQLRKTAADLASLANIRCPEVCLVDSGAPLAFTVRTKRKYVLALSVGLLESFDTDEVEACVAHEIAHLKNNDFTIRFLATLAKVALFSKPLSYIIEPAIYRAREFQADKTAASLIGGPDPLISVLAKLRETNSLSTFPATSSSVCACFFGGEKRKLNIFEKHPTLDSRIRLLEELKSS